MHDLIKLLFLCKHLYLNGNLEIFKLVHSDLVGIYQPLACRKIRVLKVPSYLSSTKHNPKTNSCYTFEASKCMIVLHRVDFRCKNVIDLGFLKGYRVG